MSEESADDAADTTAPDNEFMAHAMACEHCHRFPRELCQQGRALHDRVIEHSGGRL